MISNPVNPAVILSATLADDISQIRPVSAVPPVPGAAHPADTPALTPGQKYLAQIGERLTNDDFLVNVAGKWLQMRMPASINPGNVLELTLIEQSPQLKFLLHNDVQNGNNPTTLSPAGKFIAQLLSQPASSATKATNEAAPLLPAPPITSAEKTLFPGQLRQALSVSGLFYEAHLAQWINGNRSLQQLRQEPQGRLPANTIASTTAPDSAPTSPVAPQTASLIQQQLHTLETGTIQWRGEIWPGQAMEWDITGYPGNEEKEEADHETAEKPGHWQTRIHLQLPNLGKITATLMIEPEGMRIQLDTNSDEITQQLKKEQVALVDAMQTTGLTIRTMEIQQHETT